MTDEAPAGRALSRNETHDLGMILKERAKVLRHDVEEKAAMCLADFETKLAAVYSWDEDETWKKAAEEAKEVVAKAQETIAKRCKALGIPKSFAPSIGVAWAGRGENASRDRRTELRHVAKSRIDAMSKSAIMKIEHQALNLRTQVVAMGLVTAEAKMFLESLAPVEDMMRTLEFGEIDAALEQEHQKRIETRRRFGSEYDQ